MLTLTVDAGNKSHSSLSQQMLVGNKAQTVIAKDSPKRPGTKIIKSPSQMLDQSPSLASIEQDWKHQGPEDSDLIPLVPGLFGEFLAIAGRTLCSTSGC